MVEQYDVNELTIWDFFKYWPSLALACIALSLFTLLAAAVGFLTERRKSYRFLHLITVTGLCEAGGYAALIYGIERSGKGSVFNAYVAMQVLVVLSPNLIQASMYWLLGIVFSFSPDLTRGRKWLRGWVITTTFVLADLFAITIQAVGISIWASSQSSGDPDQGKIHLGCGITLAGLAVQLFSIVAFNILAIWAHRHPQNGLTGKRETRRLFTGLYLAMAFLYVRNIFRFVEFVQSTVLSWPPPDDAYVLSEQQVLFYTLDCLPILLCISTYILWHPGHLLPERPPITRKGQVLDEEQAAGQQAAGKAHISLPGTPDAFQVQVLEEHVAKI